MHSKTEILDSTDPRMRGVGIWGILGKPAVGPVGLHRPNFVWLKNSSPVHMAARPKLLVVLNNVTLGISCIFLAKPSIYKSHDTPFQCYGALPL